MIYLATPSSPAVREAMRAGAIGCMTTPVQGNRVPGGCWWGADNGAFGKGYPGDDAWVAWLDSRPWDRSRCLFATAPDIVGDAPGTLRRSEPWLPVIRRLGYPAALVAQNGLEGELIPWDEFDVLFLGGTLQCPAHGVVEPLTVSLRAPGARGGPVPRRYCPDCSAELVEWKTGEAAAGLVDQARSRGKWVHMGRVNTRSRWRAAEVMSCDSCDGTLLAFGPERNLPKLLAWQAEPMLPG